MPTGAEFARFQRLKPDFSSSSSLLSLSFPPYTNEKQPAKIDGDSLFVLGSPGTERCDFAHFIWRQMKQFRTSGLAKRNIPFPAMVTYFCIQAGVSPAEDKLTPGNPGAITSASMKKSVSLSRPPRPETMSSMRPKSRSGSKRIEEWLEIISCGLVTMREKQDRADKKLRRVERRQKKLMGCMKWMMGEMGQISGRHYVETEVDREADTESGEEKYVAGSDVEEEDEEAEGYVEEGNDDEDDEE